MSFQTAERRKFLWEACQLQIRRMHVCGILKQLFPKDNPLLLWDKIISGKFDLEKVANESQRKRLKTQIKLYRYYQRQNKINKNAHDHSPCYAAKILGIDREAVYRMLRYMARANTWLTKSEKGFKEIDNFAPNSVPYAVTDKARGIPQQCGTESVESHPCSRRSALHEVAPSADQQSMSEGKKIPVPEKQVYDLFELLGKANFVTMSLSRALDREIYAEASKEFELPLKEAAARKWLKLLESHLSIYPEKKKLIKSMITEIRKLLEVWERVVYQESEESFEYRRTGIFEDVPPAVYAQKFSKAVQERKRRKEAIMQVSTFEQLQDNLLKSDIEAYTKQHLKSCKADDFEIKFVLKPNEERICPSCGKKLLSHEEIKTKATEARSWLYQTNQWLEVDPKDKRWKRKSQTHFSMWNENHSELPEEIKALRSIVGNITNDSKYVA